LKRIIIYFAAAVLAGLSLTLIPLITSGEINVRSNYLLIPEYVAEHLSQTEENSDLNATRYPINVGIFVISFIIALVAFLLVRRKIPHDYKRIRMPPF